MRRTYSLIVVVFGMAAATFAQTTSPDSQTLQALLTEVRQLRQGRTATANGTGQTQQARITIGRTC